MALEHICTRLICLRRPYNSLEVERVKAFGEFIGCVGELHAAWKGSEAMHEDVLDV